MTTGQVQLGTLAYTTIEDDAKLSTVGDLSLLLQLGNDLSQGTVGDLSLNYNRDDPRQVSYSWG
jgi:hypothetical protein